MTRVEVEREMCRIAALVYHSVGDYRRASDGFCDLCPHHHDAESFRNDGGAISYVRRAVVRQLRKDGYAIAKGFDPNTGEEVVGGRDAHQ